MSASLADDELLITRTFDAPVDVVFSMWADPEHFRRWMGPENFTCPEAELDFRVGGTYRAMILSDEKSENWFGGTYREIEPNKRLAFTFAWDNEGPSAGVETLVTIEFRDLGGRTEQIFHQTPFVSVERRDSHIGGWNGSFNKLHEYARTQSQGAQP